MLALALFPELDPLTFAECGRLRGALGQASDSTKHISRIKYHLHRPYAPSAATGIFR